MNLFDTLEGFTPFDEQQYKRHYEDLYVARDGHSRHHEASLTHEGLAAAAGFAAMHAYEAHLRATGQPVSHGKMKEILAAIAAAEVDKLIETKGLDWADRHKARKLARHHAHHLAHQRYGEGNTGWEYARGNAGPAQEYNYGGSPPYGAQGCGNYGWYDQRYGGNFGGFGGGGYGGGGYGPPPLGPQGYGGYGGPPQGGYYPEPNQGYNNGRGF